MFKIKLFGGIISFNRTLLLFAIISISFINTNAQCTNPDFILSSNQNGYTFQSGITSITSNVTINNNTTFRDGAVLCISSGNKLTLSNITSSGSIAIHIENGELVLSQNPNIQANLTLTVGAEGTFTASNSISINGDTNTIYNEGNINIGQALTFSSGSKNMLDNLGTLIVNDQINGAAIGASVFRNQHIIEVKNNFQINKGSSFINCGTAISGSSFNHNGGEVINTGIFNITSGSLSMGSSSALFQNYGTFKIGGDITLNGEFYTEGYTEVGGAIQGNGVFTGPETSELKTGYIRIGRQSSISGTVGPNLDFAFSFNGNPIQNANIDASVSYNCTDNGTCINDLSVTENCANTDGTIPFCVSEEGAEDTDEDGIADTCDLDDDNDGILDTTENGIYLAEGDEDGDGILNYKDTTDNGNDGDDSSTSYTDANNNGIADVFDADGDGVPNHLDLDSDNDGITDIIESGGIDTDRDGKADGTVGDTETTNGIPSTAGEGTTPRSTADGDSLPDYLDIDADNDGIPDNIEAQTTEGYIAPSGTGADFVDENENGVDDNYEVGAIIGIDPENTDGTDTADYIDTDADNDGITDINENGDANNTLSNDDSDNDGLDDNFDDTDDSNIEGATVNDGINPPNKANLGDADDDLATFGDLDYRDTEASGIPMITQVYQFESEKWIEITNIHPTNNISENLIKIQLYKNKTGEQTDVTPDVTFTLTSSLAPGQSVLFSNSSNQINNINNAAIRLLDDDLTDIADANDIITLSTSTDASSWENRYDVISEFSDETSYVRIDETLLPNITYTENEWVVFIDDNLDPYTVLGDGGPERHPHDPLISEIENSNSEANTLLGLHRIDITTRIDNSWSNGYPDRSRFVVVDENHNHRDRFSARKLTVNASKIISVTDDLLVVTNDILLNGQIRLIDAAQLIQTHTNASQVYGTGNILVDQNSTQSSVYRYNYMGSPVSNSSGSGNYNVAAVFKDGTTPVNHTGVINKDLAKDINWISGFDGNTSDPISLAEYWIYTYAANDGGRSNWIQKRSEGIIPNTDGFIFKGPGRAQNYTFSGTPNDGELKTVVGDYESYLVGNPFASSISVKKFIEDNNSSITGTLYFWEHAGEDSSSEGTTTGHNFAGYIGGYAARTITMGVSARAASQTSIDTDLQAENAIIKGTREVALDNERSIYVVALKEIDEFVRFENISLGVDTLRVRYKADASKSIRINVNSKARMELKLPETNGVFSIIEILSCVEAGNDISIESLDANSIQIDYLNLKDDGELSCAPSIGGNDIAYKEPEPYIAIGQGFFVQGDVDGGTVVFNNSQREYKIEETGSSVFFKSTSKLKAKSISNKNSILEIPVIKLGMDYPSSDGSIFHRQIGVSFSEFNSFDYDKGYDAEIFDIGSTDIYFKSTNYDQKYVIAGVESISNDLEVPLEIVIGDSGEVSISIDEMKNVNQEVYITDKLTGEFYPIINNEATLILDEGTYTDRFFLTFKGDSVLSIEDLDIVNQVKIFMDNRNHNLVISKNDDLIFKDIELYNILGVKITHWEIKEQKDSYELKLNEGLPTGVYIVRINNNKEKISKKIIIL